MTTSSFRLSHAGRATAGARLSSATGPPSGYPRIYLRPAGNLHSSPRELGRFVRMLLGWGELGTAFVVDPEYLGNMEQPTDDAGLDGRPPEWLRHRASRHRSICPIRCSDTAAASTASSRPTAYSPSRDVGYVILLNSVGDRSQRSDASSRRRWPSAILKRRYRRAVASAPRSSIRKR